MSLRIALVGAVQSTEAALAALAAAGHAPIAVLTLPAEKQARHSDFVDLGPAAEVAGAQVWRVDDVNGEDVIARLAALDLDLILVIGWSRICGEAFRAVPRIGAIGYHPTLLPMMRGRAALAWTILLDVRRTGGTLFWLGEGVDDGDIAAQRAFDLRGTETLPELMAMQLDALRPMIAELVGRLAAGERPAVAQRHEDATHLAIRRPEDGAIDWCEPAQVIERLAHALTRPYPGAFTTLRGRKLFVWSARAAHYPNWHALTGQVFTYEDGVPIVRCGNGTDLALTDYSFEDDEAGAPPRRLTGQPRMGGR